MALRVVRTLVCEGSVLDRGRAETCHGERELKPAETVVEARRRIPEWGTERVRHSDPHEWPRQIQLDLCPACRSSSRETPTLRIGG